MIKLNINIPKDIKTLQNHNCTKIIQYQIFMFLHQKILLHLHFTRVKKTHSRFSGLLLLICIRIKTYHMQKVVR